MMRNRPWLVFALVFGWQVTLFLVSTQPVPANDAFFYDGGVVHEILYGGYYNPTAVAALPVSGGKFFAPNPPLYQLLLLGWMSAFGTSVVSPMALHLSLLGLFTLTLYGVLRRLRAPVWCMHVAGAFLLLLTFHDRPDTLAEALGMLAVYAWVRSRRVFGAGEDGAGKISTRFWTWLMVLLVVLGLATSLQIGGTYFMLVLLGTAAACFAGRERFPLAPMILMVAAPVALALMVKQDLPLAWAAFQENARLNPPVLGGFHPPTTGGVLKVLRTMPGVLLAAGLALWSWRRHRKEFEAALRTGPGLVLLLGLSAAFGVTAVSLTLFTPDLVGNLVAYLQPLVVGAFLTVSEPVWRGPGWERTRRRLAGALLVAMLIASTRVAGMSTWGLLCAHDFGYSRTMERIRTELEGQPPDTPVVLSSAYLYEAVRHPNIRAIHSDYLSRIGPRPAGRPGMELEGLLKQRPAELILTQFDYYRRFEPVIEELRSDPHVRAVRIENLARVRAPDSYPLLRKVVQQIAWAPVIVHLEWQPGKNE